MAIIVRDVPPEGWTEGELENRLAFRQWDDPHTSPTRSIATPSPFSRYGDAMLGNRPGCPICGHPTGDCADHQPPPPAPPPPLDTTEDEMRTVTHVQGTPEANADPGSGLYVVPDDVVEEFTPMGSKRPSHRLLARKGETITRERAIQLGLIETEAPSSVPPMSETHRTAEGQPVTIPTN